MDWDKAERNLRFYMSEYAAVPAGAFALNTFLIPLLKRFDDGERTQELYDEMMGVE